MSSIPKPPPGHFNVLYFAAATSYTKRSFDVLRAPISVINMFDILEEKYPDIKDKVLSSCAVTVNLDYVDIEEETVKGDKGTQINAGDEVAIIPPDSLIGNKTFCYSDQQRSTSSNIVLAATKLADWSNQRTPILEAVETLDQDAT